MKRQATKREFICKYHALQDWNTQYIKKLSISSNKKINLIYNGQNNVIRYFKEKKKRYVWVANKHFKNIHA